MPDPARFKVSKATLFFDRFMTQFIKVGGIGIIAAVFGIFLFILFQISPLFQNAKVEPAGVVDTGIDAFTVLGVDEWGELPFLTQADGTFQFISLRRDSKTHELVLDEEDRPQLSERGIFTKRPDFEGDPVFTSFKYHSQDTKLLFGSREGICSLVNIKYVSDFREGRRTIEVALEVEAELSVGGEKGPIVEVDFYDAEEKRVIAVVQETADGRKLYVKTFAAKKSLFGTTALKPAHTFDLTSKIHGRPEKVLVGELGNALFVATDRGTIYFLREQDGRFVEQQVFRPFGELVDPSIGSMNWLLGKVSLVFTSQQGENRIFSIFRDEKVGKLQYVQIKSFPKLEGPPAFYDNALRNRSFLIGSGREVSLRHATTEEVRWHKVLNFTPQQGVIAPKYDQILLAEPNGRLHFYRLEDPHPEAGFKAFFGKIWYEGQPGPQYVWQSTGGESSFEPKLSMIPLMIGSIKGTLYAMLFAVPIAILAAIYTSQFLQPKIRKLIKPTMEIMASLPSVVLGFLAALWLAPILEDRVPSLLMIFLFIPLTTILIGKAWGFFPQNTRLLIRPGYEFLVLIPVTLIVGYATWILGPLVEGIFFTMTDPETGERMADFRKWWPAATGTPFEQRNSLVVGFMMGFAVIPIIFTISEDALSNVPLYLNSASLALGASRWQTVWRIVLPTASAGIFSALMIGLGRAVGETMIVVMATGNTPIMDLNIFTGMRTLSANIAVELPEAPQHGTLYRALFLGAMLLFLMTFVVNTVAEIARQRLREKYKTVS